VKGVDVATLAGVSGLENKIVSGRFDLGSPNGVVIGSVLADRLRVQVGDTLVLVSPAGMENMLTQIVTPTVYRCPVTGVFASQNKEFDRAYVFMALPAARSFFRMEGGNTGFELRFDDIERSDRAKSSLQAAVGAGWNVLTWYDLHKDLYSVMKIERWSAFILLAVIIAVAVFNILASLTMLALEKKRDIGILQTMGMAGTRIQRVFLLQGVVIGAAGTAAGLVIGLVLAWVQQTYGVFKLNAAFIIPALPVEVRISDLVIIACSTFLLCVLAAWYPATRAKHVEIIDAIRWE
jgi:lipoprotein-releasing system permease protein